MKRNPKFDIVIKPDGSGMITVDASAATNEIMRQAEMLWHEIQSRRTPLMMDKDLPDRMDDAADTLVEATYRFNKTCRDPENIGWRPVNLRSVADDFRREDRCASGLSVVINAAIDRGEAADEITASILEKYQVTPRQR